MPATVEDIAAGTRAVVTATFENGAIAVRYPSARDGSLEPAEGYFDSVDDAEAVIAARGALIGVERRRFTVSADGLQWEVLDAIHNPAPGKDFPTVRLIDPEQAIDAPCLVARIELDLENETTTYELFG